MAFWSSEKLSQRSQQAPLISPFDAQRISHGAYELALGPEAFITSEPSKKKLRLETGEPLVVPPGQFGLLLTEETVTIPEDAIGLISMRFGMKSRGLINVSGFHVDPGFSGRLKFSVYNAGSQDITLTRGERVFLIWLADLSGATADLYKGAQAGQNEITSEDQNRMHGQIASPGALKEELNDLKTDLERRLSHVEDRMGLNRTLLVAVIVAVLGLVAKSAFDSGCRPSSGEPAAPVVTHHESPVDRTPTQPTASRDAVRP